MRTLQQLRDRLIALKLEKSQNISDLAEINAKLSGSSKLSADKFKELSMERSDLVADNAEIDSEISELNTRIFGAEGAERERTQKVEAIRFLAGSLIAAGHDPEESIKEAFDLEHMIQSRIPAVIIPDLPKRHQ